MRPPPLALALGLAASCVEVISLTRAPDATVSADASSPCPGAPQDNQVWAWTLPETDPCLPSGLRPRACRLVVAVPAGETVEGWCTRARGRYPLPGAASECGVAIAPSYEATGAYAPGDHGFYLTDGRCLVLTDEPGGWRAGLRARLECALASVDDGGAPAACLRRPLGAACSVGAPSECLLADPRAGCGLALPPTLRASSSECASNLCLGSSSADASRAGVCVCRCAVADGVDAGTSTLCACPAGFACEAALDNPTLPPDMRGRYCVPAR